jgi:predicted MPP superfamily phosphohydrolase
MSLFLHTAKPQSVDPSPAINNEIVFASDTQAPMWIETLWLKSHNNRAATKSIFDDILQRSPGTVFLLGDVVNLGASNKQWKPMDAYLQRLRAKGIKVHAALGNHEVMGQSKRGQRKFQERFPDHAKTGYFHVTDSVAVIVLNSNFASLSIEENEEQEKWYKQTLDKLDEDSSVQFIITGCHHSPFTNSKIVGSSMGVREKFVPLFLKSPKSRLFLSGHSHNFEHYKIDGKDFLVIGGGGGLHQPLKKGAGILPDIASDYKPMFHYISVRRHPDSLEVKSVRLKNDRVGFEDGRTFFISKNASVETEAKQAVKTP